MRALIQRVSSAAVIVDDETVGEINAGLVVFLGVGAGDDEADLNYVARKIVGMRVFEDEAGRMNRSVVDVGGSVLLVSQFTLYGDLRKGRRPGFDRAAEPEEAHRLYEAMIDVLSQDVPIRTGRFGARMRVHITNEGPATFWLDSADR